MKHKIDARWIYYETKKEIDSIGDRTKAMEATVKDKKKTENRQQTWKITLRKSCQIVKHT